MIQFIASLVVLALVGAIDSIYLAWHHIKEKPLVCPLNHTCSVVTESKWGRIFYVRNEYIGTAYYVFVMVSGILMYFYTIPLLKIILLISSGGALLFSIFLVLVQKYIIKSYCFYCLISAFVSLLIFLNILLL